jgi:putative ABC transport system ATP-binding protein
MVADPILNLHNVCKYHQGPNGVLRILDGVNIAILKNTFTFIIGPSGSGKSTLLHIMGALERPSEGKVVFEGRELGELTDQDLTIIRRRRIGFVFQFFNLLLHLPTWQNIALPLLIDGMAPSEARQAARILGDRFALTHRLDMPAGLLSGGEMQRTAIARAMAHNPGLILADEPTGNLDQANGQMILKLLRELVTDEGHTVVMVTHNPQAAEYADCLLELIDGRVVNERILKSV